MKNTFLNILILEDNMDDILLIDLYLKRADLKFSLAATTVKEEYWEALETRKYDLILCDHGLPSYNSLEALKAARAKYPDIPFIVISGKLPNEIGSVLKEGADAYVSKDHLHDFIGTIDKVLKSRRK